MSTITQEEREEWRTRYALDRTHLYYAQRVRALDALETAEARAAEAERQRDRLAEALVARGHIRGDMFAKDLSRAWLEWAAEQARSGEEEK